MEYTVSLSQTGELSWGRSAVIYDFQGFFGGVKNPPVLNRINTGSTVPFVFSLGGNKGLNIFPAGSPSSVEIDCDSGAPSAHPKPRCPAGAHLFGGYRPVHLSLAYPE
jgi:hypothetical protein